MLDASIALIIIGLSAGLLTVAAALLMHGLVCELLGLPKPQLKGGVARRFLVRLFKPSASFGRFRRAILLLAALIVLCMAYARLVEPFWVQVETVRIESEKLPADSPPIQIALLCDTHCDPVARLEPSLHIRVRELDPDLIIFAGDALNAEAGLSIFRNLMERLAAVAPVYAVRGNWDVWWFPQLDLFGGTGVEVLDGEAATFQVGDHQIWLVGSAVEEERELISALKPVPGEHFTVAVHHYPETAASCLKQGADLALSGDTHGGQIRLPVLGPLVKVLRFGKYYDMGLHRLEGGHLYVSRGLGMEGGNVWRMRFLCRPEITLFEIVGTGTDSRPPPSESESDGRG